MTSTPEEWTPHVYQGKLLQLMLRQSAAGALLDPGLGKTSVSLAMIKILKYKKMMKRALVIAPLRPLYAVWPAERDKWSNFNDLKIHILHGSGRDPYNIPEDTDIILVNPEGLLWLLDDRFPKRFAALGCDVLIVDESTRFKDSQTKRFKLIRKHMYRFKRRYILTGSISPNGLLDLFGQIYILDRGNALGAYITHYRKKFFHQPNPYGNPWEYAPTEAAFQQIVDAISPLCMQMQAEDYLDMPDLIYHTVEIDLPKDVMARYKEVEDDFITELQAGVHIVAANAAVAGGKCRQIANGAVYYEKADDEGELTRHTEYLHQEKVKALEELLEELQGNPTIIAYEFQHDKDQILAKFPDIPVLSGASPADANEMIRAFNAGELPWILGHPASMGHGLNLQGACHHVIWYGVTWNFEHYDQLNRRVYRQGQEAEAVFIYHIVARATRDAHVLPVLASKEKTQKDLLNALIEPEV